MDGGQVDELKKKLSDFEKRIEGVEGKVKILTIAVGSLLSTRLSFTKTKSFEHGSEIE